MSDTPRTDAVWEKFRTSDLKDLEPDVEFSELARQLERELNAANERISRLEDAVSRALAMRQKWLETPGEAHAGAYYAFVKGRDADWEIISKAKEAKP